MRKYSALLFVFSVLAFAACKTQQRIRLKELYQKISDEVEGANRPVDTSKTPSLALTRKKAEKEEERKKKIKKTTFYGLKTRRAYARKGSGTRREWEIFYVLKKYQEPDPYIKDIYWYHRKKRVIMVGKMEEHSKSNIRILHGPYLKRVGKKEMEEGIYYVGTKHGRWAKYDRNYILIDKKRFYKGWPTDAEMTYYDSEHKKPKEVIPVQLGRKEGMYYYFAEDGTILATGQYKDDVKIGLWVEYHPNKKKKKETQYAKDPYTDFTPYVLKEYDAKGKLLYDFKKDAPKNDSTSTGNKN